MGHRNIQFTGHINDAETDQQSHSHLHPDPCIFYGTIANFSQPNIPSPVPPPLNQCNNFNFHPMQERQDSTLFYSMPPYSTLQCQHTAPNLDLAVAPPPGHYNPYLTPPSAQFSLSATHRVVGIPHMPYLDGLRGSFKRKNAEGAATTPNYHHHNASAGPSSSVAPMTSFPVESDMDAASFQHNGSHLVQGNYVAQHVQLPGNYPWLDMHFGANNGDINTFAWTQLPYVQAGVNGAPVEAGNVALQSYQATAMNRNSAGFLHPPIGQCHSTPLPPAPPMPGMGGAYNVNYQSQGPTSSRRITNPPNGNMNPFQEVVDPGPPFLASGPPTGFRIYRPHRRDLMLDPNARYRNFPHLRVLPEDEVAVLEIPGYLEGGESIDHHRDMRLDIDHMSYEELLALGEQIGCVGTGLPEEFIQKNLKTRTFTAAPASCNNTDEATICPDQKKINFCVVCQTDYEHEEHIGILNCGHEYHRECIKKWLQVKNTCPVCKSTALSGKAKDL